MTRIYLCHPYSHQDQQVMYRRFISANALAGRLIKWGHCVFSPLSHSVPIADVMENHLSHDVWMPQDLEFISWADEVWVPLVDGWQDSKGISIELAEAERQVKKIVYFVPEGEDGYRICSVKEMLASMAKARPPGAEADGGGEVLGVYP